MSEQEPSQQPEIIISTLDLYRYKLAEFYSALYSSDAGLVAIANLYERDVETIKKVFDVFDGDWSKYIKSLSLKKAHMFALLDDRIVGHLSIVDSSMGSGFNIRHTEHAVIVDPDFHGKGIGKRLVMTAVTYALNTSNAYYHSANVFLCNAKSIAMHTSVIESINREHASEGLYGVILANRTLESSLEFRFSKSPDMISQKLYFDDGGLFE